MKTAIRCLNSLIDSGMHCEVTKADARAALNAIEEHPLLVFALRQLVLHATDKGPESAEAFAHAERVLAQVDKSAARLAALAAPKEEQFSDLV